MLGNRHVHKAGLDVVDDADRGIECHHLDRAGLACLLHAGRCTQGRKQVGPEHALQIGIAGKHALKLRGRLVGVVVVELGFQNGDVRKLFGHRGLEAFFALVSGGDAGLHVRHEDLARAANRCGQRPCSNLAAQNVVGRNVGQREIAVARAGLVVSGADERVDRDHRNPGVIGFLQGLDQLHLVGRRDQDRIRRAGNHGVQNRHLRHRVEVRRALEHQLDAKGIGRRLSATVHRDVKAVRGQTRDQRDGELLVLRLGHGGDSGGQRQCRSSAQKLTTVHFHSSLNARRTDPLEGRPGSLSHPSRALPATPITRGDCPCVKSNFLLQVFSWPFRRVRHPARWPQARPRPCGCR